MNWCFTICIYGCNCIQFPYSLSIKQDRNDINTCMRIIEIRKMLITFINKSLEARQVEYKMATWLQIMTTKTEVARQKKKKEREKENCPKPTSFLLLFFLGEGPWIAELQPLRTLDLLP